ncbi:PQQ-dependent sugar dehydrogenase [Pelagibacterium montanilacus]|uniref:PQQ-dependent sugar dehydrogenase n=1 Tax=Pelagibacterium montanilacus TaxID=2185280 RepID=UPI000F8EF501|nr:sorbosone dehydrogenase family protein [Pelagibacterium montanilacus]
MSLTGLVGRAVAAIGAGAILLRRWDGKTPEQARGSAPKIPDAKEQSVPTLKMPTAKGWEGDHTPVAASGLKVNAFARGLDHPRQIYTLPNGDVLVAESCGLKGDIKSPFDFAQYATMKRARAVGESANRITLLRDADGDGVAEIREDFLTGLSQPYGMALVGSTLYVGNTDGVVAFPYEEGQTKITAKGRQISHYETGGHWTRNLIVSADQTKLYVAVGSLGNIDENGMAKEEGRAAIHEIDLATETTRIFAGGLRNPVGMAWGPDRETLWTVVNERDGLGDETPPDYLTSVQDGGFYGWPFCYWDRIVDDRVKQDSALVARAITPDFALGGHTASLGLCWVPEGVLPGMGTGMAIGQHGSWNRSVLSGYKLAFVPFADGKPAGPLQDVLTGFLSPDEKHAYGRPVGVAVAPDNALLMADDVGDVIWRVSPA